MTPRSPTPYAGMIPVTGQRYSGQFPALLQGKECNTLRCKTRKIYCEGKAFNLRQASSKCQLLSTLSSYTLLEDRLLLRRSVAVRVVLTRHGSADSQPHQLLWGC